MGGSILNFFLLVLGILLYFCLDISYKQYGFFETLLKKNLEFVLSKENSTAALNLGLVLLPVEVDPISEE